MTAYRRIRDYQGYSVSANSPDDEVIELDFQGKIPRASMTAIARTAAERLADTFPHNVFQHSVQVHQSNGAKVSENCIYGGGWHDERAPSGQHRLVFCSTWYQPHTDIRIADLIAGLEPKESDEMASSSALVVAAQHVLLEGLEPHTLEFKLLKRRLELQQGIKLLRINLDQITREREEFLKNSDRQIKDIESDIAFYQAQVRGLEAETAPEPAAEEPAKAESP